MRVPAAPEQHDQRNQNETRRAYAAALRQLTARLTELERQIEAGGG